MVGIVRDIVIPVNKNDSKVPDIVIPVNADNKVLTIVCEILTTPKYANDEENENESRLWKMASAWRVISFFLVVFVLPTVLISLPLYARYHLYHARHLPMTETDTRALNHAVSAFWCQGQRVTSNGTLDAFLVAGSPRVQEQRRHVTLHKNLTLQHDDIEYWGVYLLKGSSFTISSAARWVGGTLLVVKGEENLRKCFYREERIKEQLSGGGVVTQSPLPAVYKSVPDNEPFDNHHVHADYYDDDEEGGGEVFDEYFDNLESVKDEHDVHDNDNGNDNENDNVDDDINDHINSGMTQAEKLELDQNDTEKEKIDDLDDIIALLSNPDSSALKNDILKKINRSRAKEEKKKNKILKKREKEAHKERHGRTRRSRFIERVRRDIPTRSLTLPERSPPEHLSLDVKLDLLHKFNDTIDVRTGNSSISSSEEFLEQCSNTILAVDLTASLDWEKTLGGGSKLPVSSKWQFTVNESDYYYFIFTSDNTIELNYLGFNLDLDRATYDVSSPIESCRNSSECVFPLAFTQTESVVVEVPATENLSELHSFEVTTTCQPRVPVYMVFILLVPFIILIVAFQ